MEPAEMPLEDYLIKRNSALINLDMEFARKMMPGADNDHVRLIAMHKARYEVISINDDLRLESGNWLRKRGYGRMMGEPVLPDGELP